MRRRTGAQERAKELLPEARHQHTDAFAIVDIVPFGKDMNRKTDFRGALKSLRGDLGVLQAMSSKSRGCCVFNAKR